MMTGLPKYLILILELHFNCDSNSNLKLFTTKKRIMKTKLLACMLFLFFGSTAFCQTFKLGIKGGASFGKISGISFQNEFTLGYQFGAFATIGFGKKFAIQPEVLFSQTNTDTSRNFSEVYAFNYVNNIKLGYLTIPVLLNYNLNKLITLQAGPQYGILISQNQNLLQNGKDAFKSGNFCVVGGVQVNLLRFRFYGRFVGGLTDISTIGSADTWKTTSYQLGAGIVL